MRTIPLIFILLAASPAFGQSRLYTNADLGRPLSPVTVTPDEWASVVAHQFRLPLAPERPPGPTVVVVDTTPAFARSTEELIDAPANYAVDAYSFNRLSSWAGMIGGYYGYSVPSWPHHRSWQSPAIVASPAPTREARRASTSPGRRRR
jgi:hypothetical protein